MKNWKLFLLTLWLFLLIFPVLLGVKMNNDEYTFSGLIFNPIDGYSYYAKMQQGLSGNWTFQLPYSPFENEKIIIFTLYLFLGNLSRLTGLTLPFIYHFFRIAFAILFFFSFSALLQSIFKKEDKFFKGAFISILFGGGLGWIYFLFGDLPADFWLAEAYGFLSAFSNLHFILSLLIMTTLAGFVVRKSNRFSIRVLIIMFGLILVNISPFAAVVMGFVFGVNFFIDRSGFKENLVNLILFCIPVGVIGGYQLISINNDPYLKIWNIQNLTPSPSVINLIFSFSPLLIGIVILLILLSRKKIAIQKPIYLFISWIAFAIIMAYIPVNLQRRFLVGFYIPLAIVFWYLIKIYSENFQSNKLNFWIPLLIAISLPSNLILYLGSTQAIKNYDPIFYQKNTFLEASKWMVNNLRSQSVVLTDEDYGLKLPANGYFQVVYGHPFESINAVETRELIEEFWDGRMSSSEAAAFIHEENVDYILCDTASNTIICPEITGSYKTIYDESGIKIFQVIN